MVCERTSFLSSCVWQHVFSREAEDWQIVTFSKDGRFCSNLWYVKGPLFWVHACDNMFFSREAEDWQIVTFSKDGRCCSNLWYVKGPLFWVHACDKLFFLVRGCVYCLWLKESEYRFRFFIMSCAIKVQSWNQDYPGSSREVKEWYSNHWQEHVRKHMFLSVSDRVSG